MGFFMPTSHSAWTDDDACLDDDEHEVTQYTDINDPEYPGPKF